MHLFNKDASIVRYQCCVKNKSVQTCQSLKTLVLSLHFSAMASIKVCFLSFLCLYFYLTVFTCLSNYLAVLFQRQSKFKEAPCLDIITRRGIVQNSFVADELPNSRRRPLFPNFHPRPRCPTSISFSLPILENFLLLKLGCNLVF